MPELHFKGKEFVYNHHLTVPYRPLEMDASKSIGQPSLNGNLIIHGDNLHALKALLPLYAGKVDCIFIDPPYNTGNENWSYNDNVNSPMMREWLSANPVTIEDGLRHDKWCAMMYPRLKLLHELLAWDGVLLASIDDNELYDLKLMCDEIFGDNWVGTIVWKNVTDNNPTNISSEHEYIVCFAKNRGSLPKEWKSAASDVKDELVRTGNGLVQQYPDQKIRQEAYSKWLSVNKPHIWPFQDYKFIDKDGIYTGSRSVHNPGKEGYHYDVLHPVSRRPCKEPLMGYRFPPDTMKQLIADDRIIYGEDESKIIELKVYVKDYQDKLPGVINLDGRSGANELRELFPEVKRAFNNPKPVDLMAMLLSFVTKGDSLVLDSFAGSGTTAHAALSLNQKNHENRRFILVESEEYAEKLTAERVRRAIKGVATAEEEKLRVGAGGEFTFCTLGPALDLDKILTGKTLPSYEIMGAWLFHTATGESLNTSKVKKSIWFLGESSAYHVWLVYKPDLDFLKANTTALTLELAQKLSANPDHQGKRHLVFAPAKYAPNSLLRPLGVEYAPLPFALYRVEKD